MIAISSTNMKHQLGRYLECAIREPVEVTKSGRRVAVLLSAEEYDRLRALEDRFWGEQALAAAAEGFLGPQASFQALTRSGDAQAQAALRSDQEGE